MRRIAALILALGMLLSACSGGDSADMKTEATAPTDGGAGLDDVADRAGTDMDVEGDQVSLPDPDGHKVIHKASISIEAEETRTVYEDIRRLVDRSGGFIESASVRDPESGEDQPRIDMVVRIPDGDLTDALDSIGSMATRIVAQTESGQDVTDEYFDLEARIENLELLETELRELLADVRQNDDADPQKLLQVFNEISRVRGEIEQLEGRRQVLDDLTTLATVEVNIAPTPEVTPVVADGWAPLAVARQSLQDLVGALQGLTEIAIRVGIFLVPLALLVAVPGYLVWRYGRRFVTARNVPGS